ncbi:universal stress protein [Neptunomonas sp. XY-337]|uniref:universal stress protein n=1 Tax=Neptunomonas sp. XY-337 TaxID=2561897 RepID=UPI0010AB3967|nr:universal stress protein [Neptunomonas sp. XY-337]
MLPTIKTILYSTDLSIGSTAAFEHAAYLAKTTGANIHVLHVVEKLSREAKITLQTYVLDAPSRKDIFEERVHRAQAKLEERQNNFWNALPPEEQALRQQVLSVSVVEGYPAETILLEAQKRSVDLIVMGTHEKGMIQTFLGSVAKNVLSRAKIPVMTVPLPERRSD